MTSDIEKQFFEAFGIKAKSYLLCTSSWDCIDAQPCEQCYLSKLIEDEYPKIADRILLKLICILTAWHLDEREPYEITGYSIKRLKNQVLQDCISLKNSQKVKEKVRALFKDV